MLAKIGMDLRSLRVFRTWIPCNLTLMLKRQMHTLVAQKQEEMTEGLLRHFNAVQISPSAFHAHRY